MEFLTAKGKLALYSKASLNFKNILGFGNTNPLIIAWIVTNKCNLKCKHCTSYLSKDKIDCDFLLNTANRIAKSKCMIVIISGGEPLVVPNIIQIISILKAAGKKVVLNTNGYLLNERLDDMLEVGIDNIAISFDSHHSDIHDLIRGRKRSFEKAITALKSIKSNNRDNRPYVTIRFVVMKSNYNEMSSFVEFFEDLVDEIKFQPVHDYEGFDQVVDKEVLFDVSKSLSDDLKEKVSELVLKHPQFDNFYIKNIPRFLLEPVSMEVKSIHHCLPVWFNFLLIDSNGDCKTCAQTIGNISNGEVADIWNSEKRMQYLISLSKYGKCKVPCWLNCNSIAPEWQGKVLKKLLKTKTLKSEHWEEFKKTPNFTGIGTTENLDI